MLTTKQNKCKVYKGGVEKAGPRIKKLAGAQMPGNTGEVGHAWLVHVLVWILRLKQTDLLHTKKNENWLTASAGCGLKNVVLNCVENWGFLSFLLVLGFFKGTEWKHSVSLGRGRSRGDVASRDKKLAFGDNVWLLTICECSGLEALKSPIASTPWLSLENSLHHLAPVGSSERAVQVRLQSHSCYMSDRLDETEQAVISILCLYQILWEKLFLLQLQSGFAWEVLEILNQSVAELSTLASRCIW